jgi:heme oxygenase
MINDLAMRLREGTKHSHTAAENTAYMKCFLKGIVERDPFSKLLANLYFLYSTLEAEMERHRDHPVVGPMYFSQLNRTAKLAEDLEFFYGENWRDRISPTESGEKYVARVLEISETNPALLIAHAYVRYMGDLSGGQGLRKIARSALNLPADKGTGLHEFDGLDTPEARRAFKARYRDTLNSLPVDETLAQQIVDEANDAFTMNRDVMHDLEDDVKNAIGDRVFDLITRQDIPGSTERSSGRPTVELIATE